MPAQVNESNQEQEVTTYHCEDCNQEFNENESESLIYTEYGDCYCSDCYHESYTRCEECNCEVHLDNIWHAESTDGYYCEECYPGDGEDVDLSNYNGTPIPASHSAEGDTFSINKFERLVGVEIETIADEEPNGCHPESFRRSYDGSIEGEHGCEYISKPMNGDQLFHEIDEMGDYLWNEGYHMNRSCGLHIHIDARDLFYKELKGIMLVIKSFEDTIFNILPKSRSKTNWCKKLPMTKESIMQIHSDSDFIASWYDYCGEYPSMDKYNDSRYHGLNLHARVYLGTIEFRYHSGTNNKTKIKNWITICQSIVQKGIEISKIIHDNSDPETWTDENLRKLVFNKDDLGLENFIEILNLKQINQYIMGRWGKFDRPSRYTTDTDREYITNNWSTV